MCDGRCNWTWVVILLGLTRAVDAQWANWEVVDPMNSRAGCVLGLTGDGLPIILFSGPTDGFSCDGTADVYVKYRASANNWVEPAAISAPSRLRVTRPSMAVDAQGNIYVAFELRWAYYTGIMKFVRTGPTTWVRDGDYVLIKAPTPVACGQNDPSIGAAYMYGYNPQIGVTTTGQIYVSVNRSGNNDSVIAYNSGANWKTGWTFALVYPSSNVCGLSADTSGDMYAAIVTTNSDPNLSDNVYLKFHNGQVAIGPTVITDGGARTGNSAISVGNSVYLASPEWNYGGSGVWTGYSWRINGTIIDSPINVSGSPSGFTSLGVAAKAGWFRYYWRQDVADARWGWFLGHVGFPPERISRLGHDVGQMDIKMDAAGNLHAAVLDFDSSIGAFYSYTYRANDEPAPGGPSGTISGTVRDQFNVPISNATVTVGAAGVTTTAANGTYAVTVPVGTYNVSAAKAFYTSQLQNGVAVTENQTTTLNFTLSVIPPAPVTNFIAAPGNTTTHLSWLNPSSGNFNGAMIRFRVGSAPSGPTDGTLLADRAAAPGSPDAMDHNNLVNGAHYYYAAFAHDIDGHASSAAVVSATPFGPADFDHDGDVDQADFGHLQACLAAPGVTVVGSCVDADLNGDSSVDKNDLPVFLNCFSGPDLPASPTCAN